MKELEGVIVCLSGAKVNSEDCLPDGVLLIWVFETTLEASMLTFAKVVCKGSGGTFIAIACHRFMWVVNEEAEIYIFFNLLDYLTLNSTKP